MKKTVVLILMFLLVLSSFSTVYADSNIKGWHSDSDAS